MALYCVSIRTPDVIGPTVCADTLEAPTAQAARDKLEQYFLRPLDDATARDDFERRFYADMNERREQVKRQGYIVLARRSKAKVA